MENIHHAYQHYQQTLSNAVDELKSIENNLVKTETSIKSYDLLTLEENYDMEMTFLEETKEDIFTTIHTLEEQMTEFHTSTHEYKHVLQQVMRKIDNLIIYMNTRRTLQSQTAHMIIEHMSLEQINSLPKPILSILRQTKRKTKKRKCHTTS
jgi:regulator of replication initiation timing